MGIKNITINSLRNKKSNGNQVIYFEYMVMNNEEELIFRYNRIDEHTWRVELVTRPHEEMPYRLFSEVYQIPNTNVPLTVVCGIGLLAIKEVLSIEVQYYSTLQFTLLNEVERMR